MPGILTGERKQKARSTAEARLSSTEDQPLFAPVTAREMAEAEG